MAGDEPVVVGIRRGLGPVGAARLHEDAADVVGGGVFADGQFAADRSVASPLRDQLGGRRVRGR